MGVLDAHEEDVRQHFSACGDIVNVRLIRDRETRLGKGFGYVEFKVKSNTSHVHYSVVEYSLYQRVIAIKLTNVVSKCNNTS